MGRGMPYEWLLTGRAFMVGSKVYERSNKIGGNSICRGLLHPRKPTTTKYGKKYLNLVRIVKASKKTSRRRW